MPDYTDAFMDLFQLEAFLAVVREGSFSAAAKVVLRTQPAVSQIVKKLEDEIGQPLFDRSSRRGKLTDAGEVLAEHAERLLNLRGQALAALGDLSQLRAGRLNIAANELTCLYLLPLLDQYRRQHPAVRLTVRRTLGSRIPLEVRDFGADFGIVTYQPDGGTLRSIVIYRDELAFVVPPSHPLAGRKRVTLKQLGSEAFVAHHVASPYRQKVVETFRLKKVTLQMPVEMPTIDAIKQFVTLGHGVALMPAVAVTREIEKGELVRIPVPELAFERQIRLVYRRGATLSSSAAAFLQVAETYAKTARGRHLFKEDRT
jgi:DNA-binding transcriptional LysR family regulator